MTVYAATLGSCCGHNFNLHDLRMEGSCLACHCGAFIPNEGKVDETEYRQCWAHHPQHMNWRCKFHNTRLTKHDGDHAYSEPWVGGLTHRWTDGIAMYPAISNNDVAPASERQVGGEHYRKHRIQVWDIWKEYDLNAFEGAIIKYVLRHRDKNGIEDLKKARHTLDALIEFEEARDGGK